MTDPLAPSTTATTSRPSGTGLAGGQPSAWAGVGAAGEALRIDTTAPAVPTPASQAADSPTRTRRARRRGAPRRRTALGLRLVMALPFRSTPSTWTPGNDQASSEIQKPSASRPRRRLLRVVWVVVRLSRSAWPEGPAGRPGASGPDWVTTGSAMSRSTWVQSIPPKGDGGRTRSTTGPSGRSARRSAGRPAPRPGRSRLTPRPR